MNWSFHFMSFYKISCINLPNQISLWYRYLEFKYQPILDTDQRYNCRSFQFLLKWKRIWIQHFESFLLSSGPYCLSLSWSKFCFRKHFKTKVSVPYGTFAAEQICSVGKNLILPYFCGLNVNKSGWDLDIDLFLW